MFIEKELLKKVQEITFTDYEEYQTKEGKMVLVDLMGVKSIIEDLIRHYHILEEQKEDMEEYYKAHYKYVVDEDYL